MRLLIVIHIFYTELWPQLASCLASVHDPFELRVTCVSDVENIRKMVHESFPSAHVEQVENRGFDVWPFLHVISKVDLNDFDVIIKLHTKRDIPEGYDFCVDVTGTKFRDYLLAFCRTPESWEKTKLQLDRPKVGMVGSASLMLNRFSDFLRKYKFVTAALENIGLQWRGGYFIAGTMFAVKAELLKPWNDRYRAEDFPVPDRSLGDCLPHFLERALGYSIYSQGYRIASWDGKRFGLVPYLWKIGRYLFHIHHGRKRTIVRVCGIPVWFRKYRKG